MKFINLLLRVRLDLKYQIIKISCLNGKLTVSSQSESDLTHVATCDFTQLKEGEIFIDFNKLLSVLSSIQDNFIEISTSDKNLKISGGDKVKWSSSIGTIVDENRFPTFIKDEGYTECISVNEVGFLKKLKSVKFAYGFEDKIFGANVFCEDKNISIVCTDRFSMAKTSMLGNTPVDNVSFFIPDSAIQALFRVSGVAFDTMNIYVKYYQNDDVNEVDKIAFEGTGVDGEYYRIVSLTTGMIYIPHESILNQSGQSIFISRKDLLSRIKRCHIFNRDKMYLSKKGCEIILHSEGELGVHNDLIYTETDDYKFKDTCVNSTMFLEAVKNCPDDGIEMQINKDQILMKAKLSDWACAIAVLYDR